jgi:hypothetical protein
LIPAVFWIHGFRIKHFRLNTNPDPDPGFDDHKFKKN